MEDIVAIIPARSGSKSIKNKNIRPLNGKPIIAYTIQTALASKLISRVIVSTNCQEIADIAKSFGAEVPFLRPDEFAQDLSPDRDFFLHFLDWWNSINPSRPPYLVHLRPSTPVRNVDIVDQGIQYFLQNPDATSMRSAHIAEDSPFKWYKKSGIFYAPISNELTLEDTGKPRQVFPSVYIPNGYVDIVRSDLIEKQSNIHGERILAFETPFVSDLDSPEDLLFLEASLEKQGWQESAN